MSGPRPNLIAAIAALLCASVLLTVSCGRDSKRKGRGPDIPTDTPNDNPNDYQPLPPVSPQPSPPTGGIVDQQQFMIFHNLKRCWHSAPKIEWSDALFAKAQVIAASCNKTLRMQDISTGYGKDLDVVKALDQWYLEGMVWYPYGKDEIPDDMRRFAAMVWKETKSMGCAKADCGGEFFFVCAYSQGMDKTKASQNVTGLKPDFLTCTGL